MSRPPRLLQGIVVRACPLCLALLLLSAGAPATTLAESPDLCNLMPPGGKIVAAWRSETTCAAIYPPGGITAILAVDSKPEDARTFVEGVLHCGDDFGSCTPADIGEIGYRTKENSWAAARGCYSFIAFPPKDADPGQMPQLMDQALTLMKQVDGKLKTIPACPGGAPPAATEAPAAGRFGVGHGCSYDEPGISDGQVVCAATYTNEPDGAVIAYKWTLDGQEQPETGNTFTRPDDKLTAGEHTIVVVAVDTRTNATSESSSFQFTKPGELAATEAPEFAVKLKLCTFDSTYDQVSCAAEVANPPAGADIMYEWLFDGKRQGDTGPGLTVQLAQPVKYGSHTVQVRAVDRNSGKKTGLAQTIVQVGTAPPQGQDALIDLVINAVTSQLLPGKSADISLKAKGDRVEVKARCEKLAYQTLLFILVYDEELNWMTLATGVPPAQAVLSSVALKCGEMMSAAPLAMAASTDSAFVMPSAPLGAPAEFRLEMLRGPIRIEVANEKTLLSVETAETVVTSEGKATYGVGFDPKSGKTVVRAYQGTVKVKPWVAETPFDLSGGQQVEVTDAGAGAVAAITNPGAAAPTAAVPPGAATLAPTSAAVALPSVLGAVACLVLFLVLGGLVWMVVPGGRRRRAPVPTPSAWAPPPHQPPAPPAYPSPAPGARLVVIQGSASLPWLDLPPTGILIGRNQDCGLVLGDTLASRHHARIDCVPGRWTITDMNSSNGTLVNGVRVTSQALNPGDQIQIGSTVLRFEQ
jgi:hypothetical protein